MYLISFYVPDSHLDAVKTALFNAGAGRIGHYDACCWQTKGEGQFRPLKGSSPFLGEHHQIETVNELKVEMVCSKEKIKAALKALLSAHPYETPAYHLIDVLTLEDIDARH